MLPYFAKKSRELRTAISPRRPSPNLATDAAAPFDCPAFCVASAFVSSTLFHTRRGKLRLISRSTRFCSLPHFARACISALITPTQPHMLKSGTRVRKVSLHVGRHSDSHRCISGGATHPNANSGSCSSPASQIATCSPFVSSGSCSSCRSDLLQGRRR